MPVLCTHIDTVNVTYRISGSYDYKNSNTTYNEYPAYAGFRRSDGGGPAIAWQVYSVLQRLVSVGPGLNPGNGTAKRHFTARRANIDFQTRLDIAPERFGEPLSTRPGSWSAGYPKDVLDPRCSCGAVAGGWGAAGYGDADGRDGECVAVEGGKGFKGCVSEGLGGCVFLQRV